MKYLTLLFLLTTSVLAKTYYSKVEPYEIRYIASNVSGLVEFVDKNLIGKKLSKDAYIRIDAKLDKEELFYLKDKLKILHNTVIVNENILKNLQQTLEKKRENYKQIEKLKIKSRVEKDREFYDLVGSENSYLATQKEINTLKAQIADLQLRQAQLERNISDKYFSNNGFVLYSIEVKVGQVVNPSTPMAKVADTSKAILTLYLDEEDLADLDNKIIYLNSKKTNYKLSRISYIADTKNISKYKAQIIIKAPKIFSKLMKIDLKEKKDAN